MIFNIGYRFPRAGRQVGGIVVKAYLTGPAPYYREIVTYATPKVEGRATTVEDVLVFSTLQEADAWIRTADADLMADLLIREGRRALGDYTLTDFRVEEEVRA